MSRHGELYIGQRIWRQGTDWRNSDNDIWREYRIVELPKRSVVVEPAHPEYLGGQARIGRVRLNNRSWFTDTGRRDYAYARRNRHRILQEVGRIPYGAAGADDLRAIALIVGYEAEEATF